jgi:hypothetical protein
VGQTLAQPVESRREESRDELGRIDREVYGRAKDAFLRPEVVEDKARIHAGGAGDSADGPALVTDLRLQPVGRDLLSGAL